MQIDNVAVLGSGSMGCGIAIVVAQTGLSVILRTRYDTQKVKRKIEAKLNRYIENSEMTIEEKEKIKSKIYVTTELKDVSGTDIVIEAIVEDLDIKKELFKKLGKICSKRTILATNTSTLSIDELAFESHRQDKVIGMHFFNPVRKMTLVEIVRGKLTSDETCSLVKNLAKKMGKEVIEINDTPGFVVNRLLLGLINNAIHLLEKKIASNEEIDKAMCLGANHPLGPLALADLIGLDTVLSGLRILFERLNDVQYKPSYLLEDMVRQRCLGRKTGRGFYIYQRD